MAGRTGPPRDRVSEWLTHAAAEGVSTMMPEVAFPGMVLGYTICAGTRNQFTALVILFLKHTYLRGLVPGGESSRWAGVLEVRRRELPSDHPSSRDGWVRGGAQRGHRRGVPPAAAGHSVCP